MSNREVPSFGWVAQQVSYSASYIDAPILASLPTKAGSRVLDAGCGNGHLTVKIATQGRRVIGIDADADGIAIAKADHPTLDFRQFFFSDDPRSLFFDGEPFDAVVSTEVVEHLYAPHELAKFALTALRPGGIFVISTPYHGYAKNMALSLANGWDRHHHPGKHGGHIKFFSKSTLTTLLEDAGFRVERFIGAGRLPYLWKSMILVGRRPG